jgi:DNA topoisomerase-1
MDAAGRWQYLYHEAHVRLRERKKYQRLVRFAEALPRIRDAITRDLSSVDGSREQLLACVTRILSIRFLRPGSPVYAEEHRSFGLVTLRRRHVTIHGDLVRFDFNGKSGQQHHIELRDPAVAAIATRSLELRGKQVFKYLGAEGKPVPVSSRQLNGYIKATMGDAFSA